MDAPKLKTVGRQAIVVIHGIGEQRPMNTLRGFVDAFLVNYSSGMTKPNFFNKPDFLSELSFELRTLCVYVPVPSEPTSNNRIRLDFFEYYWANQMRGTKYGHVFSWLGTLLIRRPGSVPSRIRWLHRTAWITIFTTLILFIFGLIFWARTGWIQHAATALVINPGILSLVASLILTVTSNIIAYYALRYLGDAARYTDASPENIEDRQKIRANGIKLLKAIHESGKYDRIVVVGHSLGSIIGYDIIKNLWASYNTVCNYTNPIQTKLKEYELAYKSGILASTKKDKFRDDQAILSKEIRELGNPWLITDFVTLGSPLAYAAILMAQDSQELDKRKAERELPTCPPMAELTPTPFSYELLFRTDKQIENKAFVLHHGAPFACTRWHNGYYQNDFVGGPLASIFGHGIEDEKFVIHGANGWFPFASHTKYWESIAGESNSLNWLSKIILPKKSPGDNGVILGV